MVRDVYKDGKQYENMAELTSDISIKWYVISGD